MGDVVICPLTAKEEDRACKSYTDPDSATWRILPCTVRKTYDSYNKARQMLPFAYDTDGLDTDSQQGRGLRKKKKTTFLHDDDDDDHEEINNNMPLQKSSKLPAPPSSNYASMRAKNVSEAKRMMQTLSEKRNNRSAQVASASTASSKPLVAGKWGDSVSNQKKTVTPLRSQRATSAATSSTSSLPKGSQRTTSAATTSVSSLSNKRPLSSSTNWNNFLSPPRTSGDDLPCSEPFLARERDDFVPNQETITPPRNHRTTSATSVFSLSPIGPLSNPSNRNNDFLSPLRTSGNGHPSSEPVFAREWNDFDECLDHQSVCTPSVIERRPFLNMPYSRRTTSVTASTFTVSSRPPASTSGQADVFCSSSNHNDEDVNLSPLIGGTSRATGTPSSEQSIPSIMVVLQSLMVKQELLLRNQKNMDYKLNLILDFVRTNENAKKPTGWPTLPLESREIFYEWEIFLGNQEAYDFAVSHFSIVAGKGQNEGHMAANICRKIFSPDLASGLNWAGTELKKGIKNMKSGQLILDACGKQYKGNFNKSRVSTAVSVWLRGKSKKTENASEGEEDD